MQNPIMFIHGIQFISTNHAKQRLSERLNINPHKNDLNQILTSLLQSSNENKSIFNNTSYIAMLYEKYGTDEKFKFFECNECIFVCKEKSTNKYIIVTCIARDGNTKSHFLKKARY